MFDAYTGAVVGLRSPCGCMGLHGDAWRMHSSMNMPTAGAESTSSCPQPTHTARGDRMCL